MAYFPTIGGTFAATHTQGSINLRLTKHLLLYNDGPNTIYYVLNQPATDRNTEVTTSHTPMKNGEIVGKDSDIGFTEILIICSTGQTASIRYSAWH